MSTEFSSPEESSEKGKEIPELSFKLDGKQYFILALLISFGSNHELLEMKSDDLCAYNTLQSQ
jgi:hypothetical protein